MLILSSAQLTWYYPWLGLFILPLMTALMVCLPLRICLPWAWFVSLIKAHVLYSANP